MLRAWDALRPAASNSVAEARKMAWGDFSFPSSFSVPKVPETGNHPEGEPKERLFGVRYGSRHVE